MLKKVGTARVTSIVVIPLFDAFILTDGTGRDSDIVLYTYSAVILTLGTGIAAFILPTLEELAIAVIVGTGIVEEIVAII